MIKLSQKEKKEQKKSIKNNKDWKNILEKEQKKLLELIEKIKYEREEILKVDSYESKLRAEIRLSELEYSAYTKTGDYWRSGSCSAIYADNSVEYYKQAYSSKCRTIETTDRLKKHLKQLEEN